MKKIFVYIAMALCGALVSCGDDDSESGGKEQGTANVNANNTDKSNYATRIELPHLQPGNNYQLLVKTDPEIGVNFIIEWDRVNKAQRWTAIHWTKANSFKNWDRNKWRRGEFFNDYGGNYDPFQPDMDIPAEYRTELSDYSGSGYERGHMCASEDRICSKNVNGQTFYLSNMQPQVNGFNGAVWATMEGKVRNWRDAVVATGGEMYVCKGGTIYDNLTLNGKFNQKGVLKTFGREDPVTKKTMIPVPKYFFMAILKKTVSGTYAAMAFWAEHKNDNSRDLTPYMITIDELEKRTGYDFFCNLPDNIENAVEKTLVTGDWK